MSKKTIHVDVVIFGGGVAGLWTLNRLKKLGYHAILLETNALGSGQTICAQGIIHGGLKYALTGLLSDASVAIESMPERWKAALAGTGELDLQATTLLSDHQLLCSTGTITSNMSNFFASKLLKSRIQKLKKSELPTLLQHDQFRGKAYRLNEMIIEPYSLLQALSEPVKSSLFKITSSQYHLQRNPADPENILYIELKQPEGPVRITAQRYLFTAGTGNEQLSTQQPMQRRPLHMVMMKSENAYPLFAHWMGNGTTPRLTITTHTAQDGKTIWYLGGQLAEAGVNQNPTQQMKLAKQEIMTLFPWLDLSSTQWASFSIDRAEPLQPNKKRPDTVFIKDTGNQMVAWPTKLAFAPLLSDKIIERMEKQNIQPTHKMNTLEMLKLTTPEVALPKWEKASFEFI